jgi:hypothetical protein
MPDARTIARPQAVAAAFADLTIGIVFFRKGQSS